MEVAEEKSELARLVELGVSEEVAQLSQSRVEMSPPNKSTGVDVIASGKGFVLVPTSPDHRVITVEFFGWQVIAMEVAKAAAAFIAKKILERLYELYGPRGSGPVSTEFSEAFAVELQIAFDRDRVIGAIAKMNAAEIFLRDSGDDPELLREAVKDSVRAIEELSPSIVSLSGFVAYSTHGSTCLAIRQEWAKRQRTQASKDSLINQSLAQETEILKYIDLFKSHVIAQKFPDFIYRRVTSVGNTSYVSYAYPFDGHYEFPQPIRWIAGQAQGWPTEDEARQARAEHIERYCVSRSEIQSALAVYNQWTTMRLSVPSWQFG